jgi:hypothetical protein
MASPLSLSLTWEPEDSLRGERVIYYIALLGGDIYPDQELVTIDTYRYQD